MYRSPELQSCRLLSSRSSNTMLSKAARHRRWLGCLNIAIGSGNPGADCRCGDPEMMPVAAGYCAERIFRKAPRLPMQSRGRAWHGWRDGAPIGRQTEIRTGPALTPQPVDLTQPSRHRCAPLTSLRSPFLRGSKCRPAFSDGLDDPAPQLGFLYLDPVPLVL